MDLEVIANLGWREGLMLIIVLLLLYMVGTFLHMYRLRRQAQSGTPVQAPSASSALAAYRAVQQPDEPAASAPAPALGTPEFQFPWNEPPEADTDRQRIAALEMELDRLNAEVGVLREEMSLLREAQQKREEAKPPLPQMISPQYSDAMQMALQGQDAATISQQCGISRAEAELVVALVRNRDN